MKLLAVLVASLAIISGTARSQTPLVQADDKQIADHTDQFKKKFAIEGKLEVTKATCDYSGEELDVGNTSTLEVKLRAAGWYTITFTDDDDGFVFQTHTFRIQAGDAIDELKETNLSPFGQAWDKLRCGFARVKTDQSLTFKWGYNNGLGGPAGWNLTKIEFSEKMPK